MTVLLFPILCRTCGQPVETERRCFAIPTCFACLPPPPPIDTFDEHDMRRWRMALVK